MYEQLYQILVTAIFDGSPDLYTYGEFFCEGIATVVCAFVVALPFIIAWRFIKRFL